MAAYTASQSGNWSAQSTWGGSGPPASGDTAVIGAFTVTVDVNTTVGTSPNDATTKVLDKTSSTGSLIVATGVTLTVKGNIGGVNDSVYTLNAGASLVFDASGSGGTPIYKFVNAGFCKLAANGTSGSRCAISAVSGHKFSLTASYHTFTLTYTDVTRCDASTISSSNANITIQNNTFTSCGKQTLSSSATTNSCDISGNVWASGTGTEDLNISWTGILTSGTRTLAGNVFTLGVTYAAVGPFAITGNYFGANFSGTTGSRHSLCSNNVYVTDGGASAGAGIRFNNSLDNNYFVTSGSVGNPHFSGVYASDGDVTISNCVFEMTDSYAIDTGDCIFPHDTGGSHVVTVRNNIVLPMSKSGEVNTTGVLITMFSAESTLTVQVTHNTVFIRNPSTEGAVDIAEGNNGFAGQVAILKSNLVWSNDGTGTLVTRIQGTVNGIVTAAGADYNWTYNIAAGDNGRGYNDFAGNLDLWTGGAANGGNAAANNVDDNQGSGDPGFIDSTRNLAKWCFVRGYGAQTLADGLAALRADTSRVADLLTYVRGGFAPTNGALQNAGHDGVTVGAVEGLFGVGSGIIGGGVGFNIIGG